MSNASPSPFAALFTEDSIHQTWLDVEVALAAAQAELGIIPAAAAAEIAAKAKLELVDRAAFARRLEVTGHALVSLVWQIDVLCDGDAGGYLHWGATTVNITQTARLLLVRRAHRLMQGELATLLRHLADHAEAAREYPMAGRTHGQHALPITFGFKVATWIDELLRHEERLRQLEPRTFRPCTAAEWAPWRRSATADRSCSAVSPSVCEWRRWSCRRAPRATISAST